MSTRSVGWIEAVSGKESPATAWLSDTITNERAGAVDMQATSVAPGTVDAGPPLLADQFVAVAQALLVVPVQYRVHVPGAASAGLMVRSAAPAMPRTPNSTTTDDLNHLIPRACASV